MQDPVRTAIIGFVSGALGALLIMWMSGIDEPPTQQLAAHQTNQSDLLARIAALEEQAAGQLSAPASDFLENPGMERAAATTTPAESAATPAAEQSQQERMAEFNRKKQERIGEQLRAAGWNDAEINSLESLKEAAALEIEKLMYEQMRETYKESSKIVAVFGRSSTLLDSLGEERYDQYRAATGRPTALTVHSPLKGSAADIAGLKEGDLIRRYGPDRIYSDNDLMMSVLSGEPGDTVMLEVERDGVIFHVSVPRGPLGISQVSRLILDH